MPVGTREFEYIRSFVYRRAGIVLDPSKAYLLDARLTRIAQDEGLPSLDALVWRLQQNSEGALHDRVIDAMTTNETSFFRDGHPFEAMREWIIPRLIERRTASRTISIWSGASSTGQEAYTIAMLLREYFPQLNSWTVRIYGTDISREVVARAQAGIYHPFEVQRGLPNGFLERYFEPKGHDFQIRSDLRSMVEFRRANILEPFVPMLTPDLVFLRNVLIYFDNDTKRSILTRIRAAMAPDGVLFLGGAETTVGIDPGFESMTDNKTVYFRPRPAGA